MKAVGTVYVVGEDGRSALLKDGDDIPSWALLDDTKPAEPEVVAPINESVPAPEPVGEQETPSPPPLAGPGSSGEAWGLYAETLGVDVPENAKRDDIVAAIKEAGHPVEKESS